MSYTVDIEPVSACLRVFLPSAKPWEDPYEMSATLVWVSREEVELRGVSAKENFDFKKIRKPLCRQLMGMGVKYCIWERRTGKGPKRRVRFSVETYSKIYGN